MGLPIEPGKAESLVTVFQFLGTELDSIAMEICFSTGEAYSLLRGINLIKKERVAVLDWLTLSCL